MKPPETKHCALIVAHPGHELRVYGWLETYRPAVYILTDGSGQSRISRVKSSTRVLEQAKARPGSIYGRFTDADIYKAILNQNSGMFLELVEEMVKEILNEQLDFVAGDAVEGYNPSHDLCRMLIGAAIETISRKKGRRVHNFDFSLVDLPDECPQPLRQQALFLKLEDSVLERKLQLARQYTELANENDLKLGETNPEIFRTECLRPCSNRAGYDALREEPPYYETYGEKQVAAGNYKQVIRYREHMIPLAKTLWDVVEKSGPQK